MPAETTNCTYESINEESYHQDLHTDIQNNHYTVLYGYSNSSINLVVYHFLSILLLGIPYAIFSWYPQLKTFKYRKCSLKDATIVLVSDNHGNHSLIAVEFDYMKLPGNTAQSLIRYFVYQHTKYVWIENDKVFGALELFTLPVTVDGYIGNTHGLNGTDYIDLLKLYGPNKIEVEIKTYWRLFVEEVWNPFYIFQAYSVILWSIDEYVIYAVCVLGLTLFSAIVTLLQTRRQNQTLHDLVESSKCHDVNVLRQNLLSSDDVQETVDPSTLVPGDLLVIPSGNFIVPCDAVLLTGQCTVNESMLTGESVPVTKNALHSSNEIYTCSSHKRHTLFCGTHVIQSRYYGGEKVLARVVQTGFDTTKGSLVKSILFPTPVGFQFYKDSFKFVLVLFFIAAVGTTYCSYLYVIRKAELKDIIIRSLDIITIVVPPALPAAMTVGIVYSQNRLKKLGIFCTSPPRINISGKVKLACFDKTGTLTHDGLNMHSILPCNNAVFSSPVVDCQTLDIHSRLIQSMASCHSLKQIDQQLVGDPLDLNMFEFTNWELEEPGSDENARFDMLAPTVVIPPKIYDQDDSDIPYQIGIIQEFSFSSTLQCMSVICRELGAPNMLGFVKGAPEKIMTMCHYDSLPPDFAAHLSHYTTQGFRVIALAYKELPSEFKWKTSQRVKRDVIECDLTFLGLLIMQNPLKHETAPVLTILHNANIRTLMITGDNILTAISVAHGCGMVKNHDEVLIIETINNSSNNDPDVIPEIRVARVGSAIGHPGHSVAINLDATHYNFAIDGKTWSKLREYYPDLLPLLLVRTKIFARFQPDQKTQLVNELQKLDYIVSMVGDGANDCGALKAAHVGVSLSKAEASVAAPFTSSIPDISCIIHLILEGRCALITSFAVFKYMALYSLIQFFTVLLLYRQHSILGDQQFLYIDLIITTSLAVTIGRQGPSNRLTARQPLGSLVSGKNLIPLLLQVVLCALIQLSSLYYLYQQDWFKPVPPDSVEEVIICWENTVLFTVSCFQYIILGCVYSKGRPYRQALITNFWFLISALFLTCFGVWLTIYPTKFVAEFFEIIYVSRHDRARNLFRYTLILWPLVHLAGSVLIEFGMADRVWLTKLIRFIKRKKFSKYKYKILLKDNEFQYWFNSIITDNNSRD